MIGVYIGVGVAVIAVLGMLTSKLIKKQNRKNKDVEEIKGVRYTLDSEISKPENENVEGLDAKISYNKNDILIPVKEEKTVGKNADIKPGKYTILTTVEDKTQINIRLGGYVRVYSHGSEIVLAEGDKITPLSVGIILR